MRRASALDLRLVLTLGAGGETEDAGGPASAAPPASLVRLGRSHRFRRVVTAMAAALSQDADEFSLRLVTALATLANTLGRDLAETDWWRLLDALLLVAVLPSEPNRR